MSALTLSELREKLGDVAAVAKAIKIPLDRWPGNCLGIATALVEAGRVPGGVAVYGHWTGDVSRKSIFAARRSLGFVQHGWVALPNGAGVVDPTRWAFEAKAPYIFVGRDKGEVPCTDFAPDEDGICCLACGCVSEEHGEGFFRPCHNCAEWPYDEGGNRLRAVIQASRPLPKPKKGEPRTPFFGYKIKAGAVAYLSLTLKDKGALVGLTHAQCVWVANMPLNDLGPFAKDVYGWLVAHKLGGFVPLDNRLAVERGGGT